MGDWQPECSSDTVLAASILVDSGICADWLSTKNFPHKNEKHLVREIRLLCVPPPPPQIFQCKVSRVSAGRSSISHGGSISQISQSVANVKNP